MDRAPIDPDGPSPHGEPSAPLVADGAGAARASASGGVVFTPLYGAHSDDPLCYHLRVGRLHLLLDCGWTDLLDPDLLQPLRAVAPAIHGVLLSHPDMAHAGALPYAYAHLGLRAPVFCTVPVARLAQLMLYDQFLARRAAEDFELFTLDDIDGVFDGAVCLKYAQPHTVGDEHHGVSVTPLAAGHTLGGTIWRISKDTEDIVYAVGFNHREERILGRTVLETAVVRPAVLVADAGTAAVAAVKRKQRDAALVDGISSALGEGGSVLLPVDTGGRVLELLAHLEHVWGAMGWAHPVLVATGESYSMVECAKGMLEWLNPDTARQFDASRTSPFNFKYIRLCHSVEEVEETPGPKVVLASLASMEAGFARALFVRWAPDLRNTLLFTSRAPPGSLAHTLQTQDVRFPVVSVSMSARVPLEGEELREYEEQQRQQQQLAMDAARGGQGDAEAEAEQGGGRTPRGGRRVMQGRRRRRGRRPRGRALPTPRLPPSDVFCEGFSPLPLAPFPRALPSHGAARSREREGWVAGPVFPFSEGGGGGGRWDEYGEVVDAEGLAAVVEQMRGPIRPTASGLEAAGVDMAALAEAEDALALMERPSRVRVEHVTVQVNCAIRFVDYEGLADGRSVRTMLAHVQPLKLILVHGTAEGTAAMQQQALAGICSECVAPRAGESVDLTADLATFKVKLTDDIFRTLHFNKLPGDYEVAYVEGRLHPSSTPPPPASLSLLPRITGPPLLPTRSGSGAGGQGGDGGEKVQGGDGEGQAGAEEGGASGGGGRPLMELVPVGGEGEDARRRAVMVGDVKLNEFRVLLQAHGLQAGFVNATPVSTAGAAVLKCGDSLAIRKVPDHRVVLEGSISDDYYRVRQMLYSQYSTL
ncbi:hypothetical protein CLOM_g16969 [Closterium sp. NIES-68]|nr:hypothetical protein CLOM_g16969 [Closterium sp. NIES-68]